MQSGATEFEITRHQSQCDASRASLKEKSALGPWIIEPDRKQWKSKHGLQCLIVRNPLLFNLCGYVGVPEQHPLFGRDFLEIGNLDAHGGLTYSGICDGAICHLPAPGELDHLWWFGFDCAHSSDLVPGHQAFMDSIGLTGRFGRELKYRTLEYVEQEVEQLAEQLSCFKERIRCGAL